MLVIALLKVYKTSTVVSAASNHPSIFGAIYNPSAALDDPVESQGLTPVKWCCERYMASPRYSLILYNQKALVVEDERKIGFILGLFYMVGLLNPHVC